MTYIRTACHCTIVTTNPESQFILSTVKFFVHQVDYFLDQSRGASILMPLAIQRGHKIQAAVAGTSKRPPVLGC